MYTHLHIRLRLIILSVCQYNGLIAAILERSETKFQRRLVKSDINYRSPVTSLSPLHFATTWPYALRILVESGVNIDSKDKFCRRPIHLAVILGQLQAVRILLQGDCAISRHDRSSHSLLQMALSLKDTQAREATMNAIAEALVDRHTRLFKLVASVLPVSGSKCRVDTKATLNGIRLRLNERLAPGMIQGLEQQGCAVPSALDLNNIIVYQVAYTRFPLELAEKLCHAGFQDLESHYSDGLTPLLDSWFSMDFEMISWLINKGASPYSRHKYTGGSGLHLLALNPELHFPSLQLHMSIRSIYPTLIAQLNAKDNTKIDSCSCLCCPGGCTPHSTFLDKGSYYGIGGDFDRMPYSGKVQRLRVWQTLPLPAGQMPAQMQAHLRLIAFLRGYV